MLNTPYSKRHPDGVAETPGCEESPVFDVKGEPSTGECF